MIRFVSSDDSPKIPMEQLSPFQTIQFQSMWLDFELTETFPKQNNYQTFSRMHFWTQDVANEVKISSFYAFVLSIYCGRKYIFFALFYRLPILLNHFKL